jgi:predicted alpha/beta hydrolase family esterase
MQKRVFIIHGWGSYPEEGWLLWLRKELESRNFLVKVPAMPDSDEPEIGAWVYHLEKQVEEPDENTYFIGHSIGCQTILRYLESLPENKKVGGAVFVAGWIHLIEENLSDDEEIKIAKPWLETPINFEKVLQKTNKFTAIFSDNDPHVPIEEAEFFKEKLGAKTMIEHNKSHFSGDEDGIKELPIALEELLKISNS